MGLVPGTRHVVANPKIDEDGSTARVRAYVFVISGGAILIVGTYDDTVVRTANGGHFR